MILKINDKIIEGMVDVLGGPIWVIVEPNSLIYANGFITNFIVLRNLLLIFL